MTGKDFLIAWLNDAHGMENALIQILEHRIKDAKDYPEVQAKDEQHLEQTRCHADLVKGLVAQSGGLIAGISRDGMVMASGLARGLDNSDAGRFGFLLATPIILAAGVYKIPDLFGPLGTGIRGQVLAGSVASFVCAYLAVRFLTRYFQTRTLTPFAIYCAAAGAASLVWLSLH